MTLDIKKYLTNLIQKEAKISHFQVKVDAGKASRLKGQVASSIKSTFGDSYLQDADYILFFEKSEAWSEDDIKKLFELTNRALGKDANMLSKSDFNKLDMSAPATDDSDEDTDDDSDDDSDEDATDTAETSQEASEDSNTLFLKVTLK